jgi:hypothetical protein
MSDFTPLLDALRQLPRDLDHRPADLFRRGRIGWRDPVQFVGWAKRRDANAAGGVPTIQPWILIKMVGTAHERLCPPYDYAFTPGMTTTFISS